MSEPPDFTARERLIAWGLVAAQMALIVAVLLTRPQDHWPDALATAGLVVTAVGAALGMWTMLLVGVALTPSPLPTSRTRLVTRGPYRFARHPMYTAVLLFTGGVALWARNRTGLILWIALALLLTAKSEWEEQRLLVAFPEYAAYRARTARFGGLPRRPAG